MTSFYTPDQITQAMLALGFDSDQICNLLSRLKDGAPQPSPWISIKDRLPEDSQFVLAKVDSNIIDPYTFAWRVLLSNGTYRWYDKRGFIEEGYELTHWMPIPELPKPE